MGFSRPVYQSGLPFPTPENLLNWGKEPTSLTLPAYAILLFTASDFTSITSHIHNWALFSLWLRLFNLSGVISPQISHSILGTYWPGEFIFQCPIFLPFHTAHGVLHARILKWLPFPSPMDHVLAELSTMTHPSWVALHGMACSFIELKKFSVHVLPKPSLKAFEHNLTTLQNEHKCTVFCTFFSTLSLGLEWKLTFSSPVATAESSRFADILSIVSAPSFSNFNSSAGISSPPLALFLVMFPKAHLTLHSRMSGSRSVTTSSWLSASLRPFLYIILLCSQATSF